MVSTIILHLLYLNLIILRIKVIKNITLLFFDTKSLSFVIIFIKTIIYFLIKIMFAMAHISRIEGLRQKLYNIYTTA